MRSPIAQLEQQFGMLRSQAMYYWNPFQRRKLIRFYQQFIPTGALCFDIGAHLGNRLDAWLALDTQIVGFRGAARKDNFLPIRLDQGRDLIPRRFHHLFCFPSKLLCTGMWVPVRSNHVGCHGIQHARIQHFPRAYLLLNHIESCLLKIDVACQCRVLTWLVSGLEPKIHANAITGAPLARS